MSVVPKQIKNRREAKVSESLQAQGYEVYHKGFPDFLAYNPQTSKLLFVEVKRKLRRPTEKMGLSAHQRRVIEILRKFHEVQIIYEG